MDEFLADLKHLALLVGGLLPERWMACTFVLGLSQQVRPLLTGIGQDGHHDLGSDSDSSSGRYD